MQARVVDGSHCQCARCLGIMLPDWTRRNMHAPPARGAEPESRQTGASWLGKNKKPPSRWRIQAANAQLRTYVRTEPSRAYF